MPFNIPIPRTQIDFSVALAEIRNRYLQEALSETINGMPIVEIDQELGRLVPADCLAALARHGLRGELVFPVPAVLKANPYLLGYYRLLLGFSQKEFYTTAFGASGFKAMEASGRLSKRCEEELEDFCLALIHSACALIAGVGPDRLSKSLLDDLTLLTLGPQLRGGANVKRGSDAIVQVFEVILGIVRHAVLASDATQMEIQNAAGRNVRIAFASDPDIVILEEMAPEEYRNVIAIEVKGGTDFSNVHNRLGEAEKSHRKARAAGFTECWTVINVDRYDQALAHRESPTTNRFYLISQLLDAQSAEYADFRNRIISLTGIRRA